MNGTPPGFLSASTQALMEKPYYAPCGHCFDESDLSAPFNCPKDALAVNKSECIPFAELKNRIEDWTRAEPPAQVGRSYKLVAAKGKQAIGASSSSSSQLKEAVAPSNKIDNAHDDDIHGFAWISDHRFVSGSKDNYIKIWDAKDKKLVQTLSPTSSTRGYTSWITGLAKVRGDLFASGTRDGKVVVWNGSGNKVKTIEYTKAGNHICKERNLRRINCITSYIQTNDMIKFYTGSPGYVNLWGFRNPDKVWQEHSYKVSANDWVYCIEVMENKDLLVVIGSTLEFWKMQSDTISSRTALIKEEVKGKAQREHISAITRLEEKRNVVASAVFDGSVRLTDLGTGKTTQKYCEHQGRVWSVVNLAPSVIASSADDRTIKVWDVRANASAMTLGGNPGRVSALLRYSDHTLISGSCADNPHRSQEKGVVAFWDIRNLVKE